jgi:hypothetical protein
MHSEQVEQKAPFRATTPKSKLQIPNESQNPYMKSLGQIPHEFRFGGCGLIL